MSPCETRTTDFGMLGVKITCSIRFDRADDSSIHRGTHHILESTHCNTPQHTATHRGTYNILESTQSTNRGGSLSMAFVSSGLAQQRERKVYYKTTRLTREFGLFGVFYFAKTGDFGGFDCRVVPAHRNRFLDPASEFLSTH